MDIPFLTVAERTRDDLWRCIGELLDRFAPDKCANYFAVAGYGDSFRKCLGFSDRML